MKRILILLLILSILLISGCQNNEAPNKVVATTKPVYDFTVYLCADTGIEVDLLVTEQLSCLHDYTLQVQQMRLLESAQVVIMSGAGLESFLDDALLNASSIIDASENIQLICSGHVHDHGKTSDGHHHEEDPHIWLNIDNARKMAFNIYKGLIDQFPEHEQVFRDNLNKLDLEFDALDAYGKSQLSNLTTNELITFHDGFAYFADYFDLHIIHSLEEESGSEASAAELIELIHLVNEHSLPAIFIEENGSTSASEVIAAETGADIYRLNMAMADDDYFKSMYQNINQIKEALG